MIKLFPVLAGFFLSACSCLPPGSGIPGSDLDLSPPVLVNAIAAGPASLRLTFDEPPSLLPDSVEILPGLPVAAARVEGRTISIDIGADQAIGQEYRLKIGVADASGNSARLIVRFFGFNPRVPRLLINEFITQGSKTHPDLIELKALGDGNLGGLAFYHGSASRFAWRFVFPARTVRAGDFILLHCKPENIPAEIDETGAPDASGGLDASAQAYDFWAREGTGLSGNNGALSLYEQPGGKLIDAVIYSSRTSESDTTCRGFGSYDLMEQADELAAAGGWRTAGAQATPEDAVNPEQSTTTRSLCRLSSGADTDAKGDFHVVPTRQASFGSENSNEVYAP